LSAPTPEDDNRRPDGAEDSGTGGRTRGPQQNQSRRQVATAEDGLAALSGLHALVALGCCRLTRRIRFAASMPKSLTITRKSLADRGGVADDDLIDMLTRHPE